jgi:surface antigen
MALLPSIADTGRRGAKPKSVLGLLLVLTVIVAGLIGLSVPAYASGTGRIIIQPCLNLRQGPNGSTALIGCVPYNTTITIDCTANGNSVTGPYGATTLWDHTTYNNKAGYVSDAYVYTGQSGPVAGPCGTPSPPPPSGTKTISISGVVTCASGGVQGIWVNSSGGGSRFAGWKAFNTSVNDASYGATFTTHLPTTIQLRVGCGGSPTKWGTANLSPNRTVSGTKFLNAFCDNAGHCSWPATGKTAPYNEGAAGQCTQGAYNWWHAYAGYWPYFSGNAGQWASSGLNGWTATRVPMPASMVVWPGTTGHVAWVNSISQAASGAITLNITEENYDGTAAHPTGHIRSRSMAATAGLWYIPVP